MIRPVALMLVGLSVGVLAGCTSSRENLRPDDFVRREPRPVAAPANPPAPAVAPVSGGSQNRAERPATPVAAPAASADPPDDPPARDPALADAERLLDQLPRPTVTAAGAADASPAAAGAANVDLRSTANRDADAGPAGAADVGPAATSPAGETAARPAYTLDAMVGQVNGKPVYASAVFAPEHEQLQRLGQSLPAEVFAQRARGLIIARLEQIVFDSLLLAEAERNLTQQEKVGLDVVLKRRREELLRQYGQGSRTLADAQALEREGKTLDELLRDTREKILIEHYLRNKLYPRIVVTPKDIERYYRQNQATINPPAGRTLRVIQVSDAEAADRIDRLLAEGKPFAEVAGDAANAYRRDEGGLMPAERSMGDKVFGLPELNQAMLALQPGQATARLTVRQQHWWLFLEAVADGKHVALRDIQEDIRRTLTRQQFQVLSDRYRRRLFAEGSFNSLTDMSDALLGVAMARYARAE